MYGLFAKVNKKNQITSLNLKQALSSSAKTVEFTNLESKLETGVSYTVTLQRGVNNKFNKDDDLLKYFIKYSNTGLFYILKLNPEKDIYKLIVPGMLFSDYKGYLEGLKKAYGRKHFEHLIELTGKTKKKKNLSEKEYAKIKERKLFNNIHHRLKKGKINAPAMMNRIITHMVKFPSNFSKKDMKQLLQQLDNRGYKKKGCVHNYEKYFKIKPDPCQSYFKLNKAAGIGTYTSKSSKKIIKTKQKKVTKKTQKRKSRSSSSKKSSGIDSAMGPQDVKKAAKAEAKKKAEKKKKKSNEKAAQMIKSGRSERFEAFDLESESDSESFTKELKKNKDEHPMFAIFRALIITCIVLAIFGRTNKFMYRVLLTFLTSPISFMKNLFNQFSRK